MCGLVACLPVYPGASGAVLPDPGVPLVGGTQPGDGLDLIADGLDEIATRAGAAADLWAETAAFHALASDPAVRAGLAASVAAARRFISDADRALEHVSAASPARDQEQLQARTRRARDACWRLDHDLLGAAERVHAMSQGTTDVSVTHSYRAVDAVLDALGRLEVRGRDSAGVHVFVSGTGSALDELTVPDERADPLFRDRAVERVSDGLSFVYKTAVLIGRLGDNAARLRASITEDALLRQAVGTPSARVTVVAHTRWASVGRIGQPNAHPVNNVLTRRTGEPYVIAALNGDVDNHDELLPRAPVDGLAAEITTDTRVIPFAMGAALASGLGPPGRALAAALASFEGSMAIVAQAESSPGTLVVGVQGSGQGMYVGLSPTLPMVASGIYGLAGVTRPYVRLDGQLVGEGATAPVVAQVERRDGDGFTVTLWSADGAHRPLPPEACQLAEVTTEDVNLGNEEHYLAKEIAEASESMRKTLRGRIAEGTSGLRVALSEREFPASVRERLGDGQIRRVILLGQGTAAVACSGIARVTERLLGEHLQVSASTATEISAAPLPFSLKDTLVIAVSQSGTTTDTNRTVDLLRDRGAATLAIVNRRDSDLAKRADGIVYTSDGRDLEMAVASTKAFYAQVAAGILVAWEIAHARGQGNDSAEDGMLRGLRAICGQLREVYEGRERIAAIAGRTFAHRAWSVVGSGLNQVAAAEARIKLSELCYKTVSVDAVEDKKHIDLSAEALVLVCAAGTSPLQRADLGKEIAIFNAHGNVPVLITDASVDHGWPTDDVITVPDAHRSLGWILATAAAHLFAYFCARAIDGMATDARLALAELEVAHEQGLELGPDWRGLKPLTSFLAMAGTTPAGSAYVSSGTALQLVEVLGRIQSPGGAMLSLSSAELSTEQRLRELLTRAVDELTRSIDSVKHQAKTVTVGTSRGDADLLDNHLLHHLERLGVDSQALNYATLDALRGWALVLDAPLGATRYRLLDEDAQRALLVTDQTGSSTGLTSRYQTKAPPVGSKRRVLDTLVPRVIRGGLDDRLVLLVPEVAGSDAMGLTLLHVAPVSSAPAEVLRRALRVGGRDKELAAALAERGHTLDDAGLERLGPELLLTASIERLTELLAGAGAGG